MVSLPAKAYRFQQSERQRPSRLTSHGATFIARSVLHPPCRKEWPFTVLSVCSPCSSRHMLTSLTKTARDACTGLLLARSFWDRKSNKGDSAGRGCSRKSCDSIFTGQCSVLVGNSCISYPLRSHSILVGTQNRKPTDVMTSVSMLG